MYDIHVQLADTPGALGRFGRIMGAAGVSLEGGGVFSAAGVCHGHFLVADGRAAAEAAQQAGVAVVAVREVLIRQLNQQLPGQLGEICAILGAANINIVTQYSDHDNRLILVTDDNDKARILTEAWTPPEAP
ncbi:hypothetical protein [Entomohabitans teleogrylli]|uniref:hypothetical protein n=1 Tax=Entomohabitans teleogrylli TaxID=1384589 RepID=UPI00073DB1C8|nr:hypothetical protein [Entomohabitans teleogrylli]